MPDPSAQEPVDAEIVVPDPVPPVAPPVPDYDERGVPTFEHVRAKIEGRHAASQGATELDAGTADAATIEQGITDREKAGRARLEEIRRSLDG